ncbi:MAG: class I mannose-6-phosphate isomerase [Bacteroidales bacterium]
MDSLINRIKDEPVIILDGFSGVFFEQIRESFLTVTGFDSRHQHSWIRMADYLRDENEILGLTEASLGGDDPLFGKRSDSDINEFYRIPDLLNRLNELGNNPYILYGIGAASVINKGCIVYFDLPKNELQYRSRAGSVTNLGIQEPGDPGKMYKRYYFIDWPVLNRHKMNIAGRVDYLVDSQRPFDMTWMTGSSFRESLVKMSRGVLRARPWFEPGAWGGKWIMRNIYGLSQDVPNYAWSFELIAPENGLILISSGLMLEFSFDFLMFLQPDRILGKSHDRFGTEFPIRFDYLDTIEGGNLSVQCHPLEGFIYEKFGEKFTQDEAYYILESEAGSGVYLGLRDGGKAGEFLSELEKSSYESTPVEVQNHVMFHESVKHDIFLIPAGTVHGSGRNNMVLEISSTPYIFTFKMYDWLRLDLNGKPRQLNIARAAENLNLSYTGERILAEHIPSPRLISSGDNYSRWLIASHPAQFYNVERIRFHDRVSIKTEGRCLVLNLVEGFTVQVQTAVNIMEIHYAETFIIPAAAEDAIFINSTSSPAVVVFAYVR